MDIGNGVLIPKTQSMSQETKVPTTSYKRATSSKAISLNIRWDCGQTLVYYQTKINSSSVIFAFLTRERYKQMQKRSLQWFCSYIVR